MNICDLGGFLPLINELFYCKTCCEKASLLPRKHYLQAAELRPKLFCVLCDDWGYVYLRWVG